MYDVQGNIVNINFARSIYKTNNENYRISTLLNDNITYYGIIDKNGNQLIEEKYRYIEYLYGNYFIASDETGALGVINSNGKIILELKYSTMQKIKGKNMLQAIENETNVTEIYSQEMKNVLKLQNAIIDVQDDYIQVSNSQEKIYIDNNSELIQDTSNLKITGFPDKIGDYKKEQPTLETVYYTK